MFYIASAGMARGGFRGGDLVTCHHLFLGHDFTL